jgi:4-amino-4-deoxy-L-arabinose transferase-like glycosyltransferase
MSTTTIEAPTAATASDGGHSRFRSLLRGGDTDPTWFRPLLLALLAGTAIAYLINLTASGDANSFYAAAVQAGTKSWKAFFFGSIDSSNFITVDKPPASLWMMELSGRIFGFSSASMLIPQVLEGVISVGLLAAAVKRWFGAGAGLLAGALLALTPVAALMFRFNNPDALLVCLLVASAYCLVRALEGASTKWLLGVGALIGFAFLAKMMQAFLVVPGFALVYMIAAPTSVRRRATQLLAGGAMIVASAGWWVAIVALWPASSRPMIDGTSDNSILNLIWSYNGIGRLTGASGGPSGGGGGGGGGRGIGANFSGASGILRLFDDAMGSQAGWFIPAALAVFVGGLIWRRRQPRTDRIRAGLILWGSWLLVSGAVFSFSKGTIHSYYTVALAPAAAALAAIGVSLLCQHRDRLAARGMLAGLVAMTAGLSVLLLSPDSGWQSWLTPLIIVTAVLACGALLAPARRSPRLLGATAVLAAVACLAAPIAYSAQTISTSHSGSNPTAGPSTGAGDFGGGGLGAAAGGGRGFPGGATGASLTPPTGSTATGTHTFGGGFGGGGSGGATTTVNSALVKLLEGSSNYRWAAATDGSQSAASLELGSNGSPVMAIGGFSGTGGDLTLAQFESYVKAGDIHYFIASSSGGAGGFGGLLNSGASATGGTSKAGSTSGSGSGLSSLFGSSSSTGSSISTTGGFSAGHSGGPGGSSANETKILAWVKAHYHSETVGGETVYNLSDPLS